MRALREMEPRKWRSFWDQVAMRQGLTNNLAARWGGNGPLAPVPHFGRSDYATFEFGRAPEADRHIATTTTDRPSICMILGLLGTGERGF